MGKVAEHLERGRAGLPQHEILQRLLHPLHKLLLPYFFGYIRLIGLLLYLGKHRRHGEQRKAQGKTRQDDIRRRLLGVHGRPQEGQGNDISRKGGHHHQQGRQNADKCGQEQNVQNLHIISVYTDQSFKTF